MPNRLLPPPATLSLSLHYTVRISHLSGNGSDEAACKYSRVGVLLSGCKGVDTNSTVQYLSETQFYARSFLASS